MDSKDFPDLSITSPLHQKMIKNVSQKIEETSRIKRRKQKLLRVMVNYGVAVLVADEQEGKRIPTQENQQKRSDAIQLSRRYSLIFLKMAPITRSTARRLGLTIEEVGPFSPAHFRIEEEEEKLRNHPTTTTTTATNY
ncbi:hypothetical protein Glove_213g89 [Diversispora epigaea]|uniref:Uncharacterized protein n=1 Tax=Diversispora epigaea TaxID=1348612 RepID=A0A397IHN6_9GLOM|nr:hypothetical protein Glove_213g89 [Diversispora epigaea]